MIKSRFANIQLVKITSTFFFRGPFKLKSAFLTQRVAKEHIVPKVIANDKVSGISP